MRAFILIILLVTLGVLIWDCEEVPPAPSPDNIFDPENPLTGGDPFELSATITAGGIRLDWQEIEIAGFSGYKIYRSETPADIYSGFLAESDSNYYLDLLAQNGHRYFYLVTVYSYMGESRSSALVPAEITTNPFIAIAEGYPTTMTHIVTLSLFASGADSMRIALEAPEFPLTWEKYAITRQCTLSVTPGVKWVYVQVKYPDGNTSGVSGDFILPRPLTPQMLLGDGSGLTNDSLITISLGDAGALGAFVWEQGDSLNGINLSPIPQSFDFNLTPIDGEKIIHAHLWNDFFQKDTSDTIILDTGAEIEGVYHDGQGSTLFYGDTLHIELLAYNNDEGGVAMVDILDDLGGLRAGILLQEQGDGLYALDYIIGLGDDITDGIVVGYFTDRAGNVAVPDTAEGTVDIYFQKPGMVFVSAGAFTMGNASPTAPNDEKPVHEVYLSDYWIGECEVTNAEFGEFLNAGYAQHYDSRMEIIFTGTVYQAIDSLANRPVRFVSWTGANSYAGWKGMRLPTEAEWEKAARGTDQRQRPWGNTMPFSGICNFLNSGDPFEGTAYPTTPVGFFNGTVYGNFYTYSDESPYGAHDILGNVCEWCQDYYDENFYYYSPYFNPLNNNYSSKRVVRSGSWSMLISSMYCSNRYAYEPTTKNGDIGFRLASNP